MSIFGVPFIAGFVTFGVFMVIVVLLAYTVANLLHGENKRAGIAFVALLLWLALIGDLVLDFN